MKKISKGTWLLALLCCFGLLAGGSRAWAAEGDPSEELTMKPGVYIEHMDVAGMTAEEARQTVEAYIEELSQAEIHITFGEDVETITMADLGFTWKNTWVIDDAILYGNTGNVLERYKAVRSLENDNVVLEVTYSWKENLLRDYIKEQAEARHVDPVRAEIVRDNKAKEFVITDSALGVDVEIVDTVEAVIDAIGVAWAGEDVHVDAVMTYTEAEFTSEMAANITDILGEYETIYNAAEIDRSTNLRVACSYINGVVLLPGESLSFFDYVYPVTVERGYRYGTAYQGGRYIDSLGGGLCQVSTTCYNAVLLAELEVLERTQHSMTVSYVKPGLDSGQAWDSGRNLNFANNTDYPVYVEAHLYTNRYGTSFVYIGLWGKETRPENRTIRYDSEYTEEWPYAGQPVIDFDPNLPYYQWERDQGMYPKVVAMAYKYVYIDGKLESKTKLYDQPDKYRATPAYWRVGTGGMTQEEFLASLPEGTVLYPPE
ncbi:MAG: VanW family protein [Lachnospiraceae bacterium]|nr:VanW family protein [Lachnospiraceae bacterium]